jgi:hypothetical protein
LAQLQERDRPVGGDHDASPAAGGGDLLGEPERVAEAALGADVADGLLDLLEGVQQLVRAALLERAHQAGAFLVGGPAVDGDVDHPGLRASAGDAHVDREGAELLERLGGDRHRSRRQRQPAHDQAGCQQGCCLLH